MSPSAMGAVVGITLICWVLQYYLPNVTGSGKFRRVEVLQPAILVIRPFLMSIMPLHIRALPQALFPICMALS